METHFGPIWPFNVAVLSFFGAAVTNWFHVIIFDAFNYLLDKKYFLERSSNIKLCKKN
uniref:Uncharacterized protein n=1 Tax=Syphacia muris TaxID=451379 RepID=A0A0N5AZ34_9BILA